MTENTNDINGGTVPVEGTVPVPPEIADLVRRRAEAAATLAGQGGAVDQPLEPVQINPNAPTPGAYAPVSGAYPYEVPPTATVPNPPPNAVDPRVQQTDAYAQAMAASAAAAATDAARANAPVSDHILTREERLAQKDIKRLRGAVNFNLEATGTPALVRDLPFADSAVIMGIPSELRIEIDSVLKEGELEKIVELGKRGVGAVGFNEAAELYEKAEAIANAACIAGFIKPRLVLHEKDLVPGDPYVWLVTDVELEDRLAFLNWANRQRAAAMTQGGAESIRNGFPT